MIHAYNEYYLPIVRDKLAAMFELAVYVQHIEINDFAERFLSSRICRAFEKADPVYVMGKSANELLGLILNIDPRDVSTSDCATPEYWVGWILAYSQWYLNRPYRELVSVLPCDELLKKYFPYHEMDIMHSVELFRIRLPEINKLKKLRRERNLSQAELAVLSGVPERTIRSYEQGKTEISKAQAETLYALAQVLGCAIEDLILP